MTGNNYVKNRILILLKRVFFSNKMEKLNIYVNFSMWIIKLSENVEKCQPKHRLYKETSFRLRETSFQSRKITLFSLGKFPIDKGKSHFYQMKISYKPAKFFSQCRKISPGKSSWICGLSVWTLKSSTFKHLIKRKMLITNSRFGRFSQHKSVSWPELRRTLANIVRTKMN